ncbi:MAG: nodH [Frankiales bacterium]|nr:nodH [Frankiales bacterium]
MATQLLHLPSRRVPPTRPLVPPELPPVPLGLQARITVRGLLTKGGERPYLLYGQGRLGSTLLGTLLSSHPDVGFGNEVLRASVRAPGAYVNGLRARSSAQHYGCHVKPYHLTDFQGVADPHRWLRRRHEEGWLLVHLQRRNTLLHVLSNVTRNHMSTSHFRAGDGFEVPRVTVDTDDLLAWMRLRADAVHDELRHLDGLSAIPVVYEDDLLPGGAAWGAVTSRIFTGLGLAACEVGSSLRKINPSRLEDFVENAEEVRAAVAGSRFAGCLDELG